MKFLEYFLRFTIGKKIFIGYLLLALIGITTSLYNLISLKKLHNENSVIIKKDILNIEKSDKLLDSLVSQELYTRRYVILKNQETYALLMRKNDEIVQLIDDLKSVPDPDKETIKRIEELYNTYNDVLKGGTRFLSSPASKQARKYETLIDSKREELMSEIKKIKLSARADQNERTKKSDAIVKSAFWFTIILGVVGLLFVAGIAMLITKYIAASVSELESAIAKFSEGKFEYKQKIKSKDEFGILSLAFSEMAKRLKQLEEMYLDASPLTHFPGGIAIENVLRKRISSEKPLAFCLLDMDNFKSFNDRYGYARGSEVIKALAKIIEDVVKTKGTADDFLGHIGGDDFVIITTHDGYAGLCSEIIQKFDKTIGDFYDPDDRKRGYITGKNRQGQVTKFPILTLSIVVVTNKYRKLVSPVQVGEIAAELKEYAKTTPGSLIIVDKRTVE